MKLRDLYQTCNNTKNDTVVIIYNIQNDILIEQGYYHYLTESARNKEVVNFTVIADEFLIVRVEV